MVVDEEACQVELLDTAGQDEFVALRDQWIRDGHGFLLIYSATSRATLDQIEKLHESICRVKESNRNAVLVIGNKADRTAEIEVRKELGASVAKKIDAEFLETSAKTGLNIEKAFVEVIRLVRALEAEKESGPGLGRTSTGKSTKQQSKKKKAKCLIQ